MEALRLLVRVPAVAARNLPGQDHRLGDADPRARVRGHPVEPRLAVVEHVDLGFRLPDESGEHLQPLAVAHDRELHLVAAAVAAALLIGWVRLHWLEPGFPLTGNIQQNCLASTRWPATRWMPSVTVILSLNSVRPRHWS